MIDFRHVITDLVRKPGAFARWRHRESLFPAVIFRKAYDRFVEELGERRGERDYLHLLKLAADTSQGEVEETLGKLLETGSVLTLELIRRAMPVMGFEPMEMPQPVASLSEYDLLLQTAAMEDQSEEEMRHAS